MNLTFQLLLFVEYFGGQLKLSMYTKYSIKINFSILYFFDIEFEIDSLIKSFAF